MKQVTIGTVDRIEDGDTVVVEIFEGEQFVDLPFILFPLDVKDGDKVKLTIEIDD